MKFENLNLFCNKQFFCFYPELKSAKSKVQIFMNFAKMKMEKKKMRLFNM